MLSVITKGETNGMLEIHFSKSKCSLSLLNGCSQLDIRIEKYFGKCGVTKLRIKYLSCSRTDNQSPASDWELYGSRSGLDFNVFWYKPLDFVFERVGEDMWLRNGVLLDRYMHIGDSLYNIEFTDAEQTHANLVLLGSFAKYRRLFMQDLGEDVVQEISDRANIGINEDKEKVG